MKELGINWLSLLLCYLAWIPCNLIYSINQSILFQKYTSNKNKWSVLLNSSLGPWSQNDLEDARPMSIKNWLKNLFFFFFSYATKTFANVIE